MIKLLFLGANPADTARLAIDREVREITQRLRATPHGAQFEIAQEWAVHVGDLQAALLRHQPDIVHFGGHARATGEILVEDETGKAVPIRPSALAELFRILGDRIRCVVLNACYSEHQAEAIQRHVDCVVGMSGAIEHGAAIAFSGAFYQSLGFGKPVKTAFALGCNQIDLTGLRDADVPRLRVRDGVDAAGISWSAGMEPSAPVHRMPDYPDPATRVLSEKLTEARARKQRLTEAGADTAATDREILDLKRQIREGGQLRAGDSLDEGRYLLLNQVGRGGFATVWRARDSQRDEIVAVKVLHSNLAGDPLRLTRFIRGARLMNELKHDAVVRVLKEHAVDSGWHYFVMEFLANGDLRRAVLEKRITRERIIPLMLPVCDAMALAHTRGILHRDIKPANILLGASGELKISDFDLVAAHDTTGGTRTGAMGTLIYTAPEAIEHPMEAEARADVYSLGMTILFGLHEDDLPITSLGRAHELLAGLPVGSMVRTVLERATCWDEKATRFASAHDFRNALLHAFETAGENERRLSSEDPAPAVKPSSGQMRRTHPVNESRAADITRGRSTMSGQPSVSDPPTKGLSRVLMAIGAAVLLAVGGVGFSLMLRNSPDMTSMSQASAPTASPTPSSVEKTYCPEGAILIPGGKMVMGASDLSDSERPPHEVTVSTFCLDRTEVTTKAYLACVNKNKCEHPLDNVRWKGVTKAQQQLFSTLCNATNPDHGDHPINCVTWPMANSYCKNHGWRLPTETEWEFAARGSSQRKYPWGKEQPSAKYLNACGKECKEWGDAHDYERKLMYEEDDHFPTTAPVGSFLAGASVHGVLDLAGSVWEWTADWFGPYSPDPMKDPKGPQEGTQRVLRGGDFFGAEPNWARPAYRWKDEPDNYNHAIGFRCAADPG
jgi:eukaryotic-like serine/threonine-protein kinase